MFRVNFKLLIVVLTAVLSACAPVDFEQKPQTNGSLEIPVERPVEPSPTPTPQPSPEPTPAPTPQPTPTATPAPSPTPTPVPPTPTPKPPTPTPTPTPTPRPSPSPTPVPTPVPKVGEYFIQDDSANKVDILIVNDNSYSMYPEQKKMSERFPSFISAIKDLDYQIAMTTTDLRSEQHNQNGRIMTWSGTTTKVLTPTTPKAEDAFKNTIKRQETIDCSKDRWTCPSGFEEPLRAMMLAMDQRHTANAGFFRDRTDLAIIVLSDEDELSNGPAEATKPQDVINRFKATIGSDRRLAVYGIVIKPGDKTCLAKQNAQIEEGSGAYYGTHVTNFAALTGGTTGSICDSDYSKNLTAISEQVRKLVGTFELQRTPKANSVEVRLVPHKNIKWRVEGNKVIFDTPPPAGTRIEVLYSL